MIGLLFGCICALYLFQVAYFLGRFIYHWKRRGKVILASVVCGFNALGWVVAPARELHYLPREGAAPLLSAAFCIGILGALCIVHSESQGP